MCLLQVADVTHSTFGDALLMSDAASYVSHDPFKVKLALKMCVDLMRK